MAFYSLIAALVFAAFIGCLNRFVFKEDPLGLGSYFFGFGSFFWIIFYALPWLHRWLPMGYVAIYTDRIIRTVDGSKCYFKGISGFSWSQEQNYYVLPLISKKGGKLIYGVPNTKTQGEVEAVLVGCGLAKISI